ncbi:uncharacterized protein LOC130649186 [Hydractinia symbiolongicarpus]|uniref:uncharacterized protein LOC130649186 n=1 Tax=Hydractinia symbiolongicarpus TaxID=13093 RepID=UPI00254E8FEF|nr:uncharacterized protein LOC130649186 [Hydractinia symbiolongicarpus]
MLLDPLTCGFSKGYFFEVILKDQHKLGKNVSQSDTSTVYHEHLSGFIEKFKDAVGFVDYSYEHYKKNAIKLKEAIFNIGKTSTENKILFLKTFSFEAWEKLCIKEKRKHSFINCKGCFCYEKYRIPLALFPIKSRPLRRKATDAGLFKPKKKILLEITDDTVASLDQNFKKDHSITFKKAFTLSKKVKEKARKAEICKNIKLDIENQWKETSVARLIGTNISIPTEERSTEVEAQLKEQVAKGVYSIGEALVPQEFDSLSLVNNEIRNEKIVVEGRKKNMDVVRQALTKKHAPYLRLHPDSFYENMDNRTLELEYKRLGIVYDENDSSMSVENLKILQRQRHIGNGHDTSSISNHSHLLVIVFCLYDKAIFYSNEEYFDKTGKIENIILIMYVCCLKNKISNSKRDFFFCPLP